MRTCEYCGHSTNTMKENCPSCNAPLPPPALLSAQPKAPPKPTPSPAAPVKEDLSFLGGIFLKLGAVFALTAAFALTASFFVAREKAAERAALEETPSLTYSFTEPDEPAVQTEEPAPPEEPAPLPATPEEAMTNPVLRQIVERYYGKDITRVTWEELAAIQFLALVSDTAYICEQPLDPPTYFEYELDWPELTAVKYDGSWQDGEALNYLTGLKTLSLVAVSGEVEGIPPMDSLEQLAIYSGARAADFKDFHKFPNLKSLSVSGSPLNSYSGLEELTKLEELGLYVTDLTDLGILSEMTNITSLALSRNLEMPGIQTLKSMTWLKELTVHDVEYSDLSVIGSLTGLERLTVANTQVKSLSFLNNLTNLKFLRLTSNEDALTVPPLSAMSGLTEIIIDCGSTEDLSYLNGLSGLKKAVLLDINSLAPLRDCPSLEYLWLETGWLLEDLSPLGSLSELNYLRLMGRTYYELRGISALGNLKKLKTLNMNSSDNYLRYDFLAGLSSLEELYISRNTLFGNLSGIGNLSNLRELYMTEVSIYDGYETVNNGGIVDTYFIGERTIDDLAGELAKLNKLEVLELNTNGERLTTLSFAASMPELRILSASDNYITDVSPLAGLEKLELADLSKNAVEDWHVLDGLINTEIIR